MQEEDQKVLTTKIILPLRGLILRKPTPIEVQIIIIVPEEVLMKAIAGHQQIMDHLGIQAIAVERPTHRLQAIIQDQEVQVVAVEVTAREVVNFK